MSRSPIPCPRCGAALADRRRLGVARWRRGVWRKDHETKDDTLVIVCPDCRATLEWERKKEYVYDAA